MTDPGQLLWNRLEAAGCRPAGGDDRFRARCPAHASDGLSLKVSREDDRVLVHCHVGCEAPAIVEALGLQLRDLFVPRDRVGPLTRKRKRPPLRYPVDKVLNGLKDYRCTPTPGFWTATCRVCRGELWIHAQLDEENRPTGPVTVSCANGCYSRKTAA